MSSNHWDGKREKLVIDMMEDKEKYDVDLTFLLDNQEWDLALAWDVGCRNQWISLTRKSFWRTTNILINSLCCYFFYHLFFQCKLYCSSCSMCSQAHKRGHTVSTMYASPCQRAWSQLGASKVTMLPIMAHTRCTPSIVGYQNAIHLWSWQFKGLEAVLSGYLLFWHVSSSLNHDGLDTTVR